jgi:putative hydrolase
MIYNFEILADMHTHSTFSKHAYSSIKENIDIARERGLKYMAITDHYFGNGDLLEKKNEFNRIKYAEERINIYTDIKIIGSCEFNLNQDVFNFEKLINIIWKPIGLHNWFVDTENLTTDDVYNLFVSAHKKGHNAFVHIERELHKIGNGQYSKDELDCLLHKIVDYAYTNDIYLEVNESTIIMNDGGSPKRLKNWLSYAKEKGNKIYLGSDAHYCFEVGKFENVIKLLNDLDYPKELILNCNEDMLKEMFG